MKFPWLCAVALSLLLGGCASGGPKTVLIKGKLTPDNAAIVHPIAVPGGLMLIRQIGGKSTYSLAIGYFGSVYVPPGAHEFVVEVSHGFKVQDAGGPAWTAPPSVTTAPLRREGGISTGLLITKGVAIISGTVQAGKEYEVKFGFDRSAPDKPQPVVWLSEVPSI